MEKLTEINYIESEMIPLSDCAVIYNQKYMKALAVKTIDKVRTDSKQSDCIHKPVFLKVTAINPDGEIIIIHDETWTFTFTPWKGAKTNGTI